MKLSLYILLFLAFGLVNKYDAAARKMNPPIDNYTITNYNVVVVPDLSNRLLRTTGISDADILRALLGDIYPRIANYKRAMNQKDRFRVVLSGQRIGTLYNANYAAMTIDLGNFKYQKDRINYLQNRIADHNLKTDATAFISEFTRIENLAKQKPVGADVWALFASGIDQSMIPPQAPPIVLDNKKYQTYYKNILIIFTDGYIEAGTYGDCTGNQCRFLSGQTIKKFRSAYQKRVDKNEAMEAFFQRNNYGIVAAANAYLKQFEVLVLQIDDRSINASGNTTVVPTDFQIIKLFWEDWMKKSGVSHFELYPLTRSVQDAEQTILSFMNIK